MVFKYFSLGKKPKVKDTKNEDTLGQHASVIKVQFL